jgi:hypothetical protein
MKREELEDSDVESRIILKSMLRNCSERVYIALMLLNVRNVGWLFEQNNEPSCSVDGGEFYSLPERLSVSI